MIDMVLPMRSCGSARAHRADADWRIPTIVTAEQAGTAAADDGGVDFPGGRGGFAVG